MFELYFDNLCIVCQDDVSNYTMSIVNSCKQTTSEVYMRWFVDFEWNDFNPGAVI